MLFHRIDQVHDSFHVVKKIRNIHDVVVGQHCSQVPDHMDKLYSKDSVKWALRLL